jgi:hypothetical protein
MKAEIDSRDAAAAHLLARSFAGNDARTRDLTLPKTQHASR